MALQQYMSIENAIVIINKTRLELLVERFNTKAQAKFYLEHAGGDFNDFESEHETFYSALGQVTEITQRQLKMKVVEKKFVPNFIFSDKDVVVVVGQDGLVANAAKYVNGRPMLAVNPDKKRNDGILLPFDTANFESGLTQLLKGKANYQTVTMAEASTSDGQHLLAFNDLFIGPKSHTSARYKITYGQITEEQSSSGIIVSTGAGSTGWLSSLVNMANGIQNTFNSSAETKINFSLPWDTDQLAFAVREPFRSKHSGATIAAGMIRDNSKLTVESYMPSNGVIFSDGIEGDYLNFNSGTKVEIKTSARKALLVTKS
jgi:NAD kinase